MSGDDDSSNNTEQTISFSVYVEDSKTGEPIVGIKVLAVYEWRHQQEYTDDTGHAHFEIPMTQSGCSRTIIHVSGWYGEKRIGEYSIKDGDVYTAHYP